jgi:hypothetical protein
MTRRFYEQHRGDYLFSGAVSAILIPQSYLSLEFILQQHNLLTEVTYPITCITLKVTRRIVNEIGTYWYRHIRPDLYRGFTFTEYFGIRIAQATLAKALFDYLYLRPLPAAYRSTKLDLAEELRLNLDELSPTDRDEFGRFVEESQSRKMDYILNNFRSKVWPPCSKHYSILFNPKTHCLPWRPSGFFSRRYCSLMCWTLSTTIQSIAA